MSEGWSNGRWTLFKCPLCGSRSYVQVRVQRSNGEWYTTEFFQCFDCSVMFKDPVLFSRCDSSRLDAEVLRGPGRVKPSDET
jgi:hypothetical protein